MIKFQVTGLPEGRFSDEEFGQIFVGIPIQKAVVIRDMMTHESKMNGFVEADYSSKDQIMALNGREFRGETLGVSIAQPR